MKKIYKYLMVVIAILVIIIIALISRPKKVGVNNSPLAITSDAQAGSFVAVNKPMLRDGDKVLGDREAPLMIFVYEDYTNVYSAKLADTLDKVIADNGGQVAAVIRPYFKNSALASIAQAAVDCAGEQEKWVEMRALLFAQAKNKQLNEANFNDYAAQIGLDSDNFAECLTKNQKSVKIEQLIQQAESYTVNGAPTMFVGDDLILGARPYDDFVDSNGDSIAGLRTVVNRMLQ